jgi:predicted Zn-dependent peptidase
VTITETTLANGMPFVSLPVPGRLSTAIAIVFPAGARHETPAEVGVAHLLEHLAFKGTPGHPTATELNRAAEYLGTELGGVSTTEYVEFSTAVRAEEAMAALELLVEVTGEPLLRADDLESERAVILQEIADADEDPASRASALIDRAVFGEHRLGQTITGDRAAVEALTLEQLLAFRRRQWSPGAGLIALAGNLVHVDRGAVEALAGRIPAQPAPPPPAPLPPFVPRTEFGESDGEVAHLRLVYELPDLHFADRRDRATAEVFSQLIGGPLGSRLFDELRERHALCYWTDGHVWGYDRGGYLSISCSVRPADLPEARERIAAIVADLTAHGPTDEEVARFRAYSTSAAVLDFESVSSRLDHAIELILEYDDHDIDPGRTVAALEAVGREELQTLAAGINPEPCVAVVGPDS